MKKHFLTLLLAALLLSGCASDPEAGKSSSIYLTSMDTVMQLTAYGRSRDAALAEAQAEIQRLDALLSTGSAHSEVSQLNAQGSLVLSQDTGDLLQEALTLAQDTDGLFDITVYPVVKLWGFYDKTYHVPTEAELTSAMALVGYRQVGYNAETRTATLGQGQSIDLGGIGKGYTSQRVTDILKTAGIQSAMVSLGGNVQCLGTKPDGTPWSIGIRDPWNSQSGIYCAVSITDKAVITSGGYERFFQQDGKTYLHILDPRTGYPAASGLSSVSIVSSDGTLGDGLSTALYIMGLETASDYWRAHKEEFDAVLIGDDGTLYATEGLRGSIRSEHEIQFIS